MNLLSNGSGLGPNRWLVLGVFAGVLLADVMSKHVSPVLAWLAGGAVIGLVPVGAEQPRSAIRIVAGTAATAGVAALAHWLTTQLVP